MNRTFAIASAFFLPRSAIGAHRAPMRAPSVVAAVMADFSEMDSACPRSERIATSVPLMTPVSYPNSRPDRDADSVNEITYGVRLGSATVEAEAAHSFSPGTIRSSVSSAGGRIGSESLGIGSEVGMVESSKEDTLSCLMAHGARYAP